VFKDYRGTELVPGVRVAYNRSGEVKLGTLVYIAPSSKKWTFTYAPNPLATIKVLGDDGKESTLARITNLVVLE